MSHYTRYYLEAGATRNAISRDHLRIIGPTIPVAITVLDLLAPLMLQKGKNVQPITGLALIDTGASSTMVDETVIESLGMNPVSVAQVGTPSGATSMNIYPAKIIFPGTGLPDLQFNAVLASPYLKSKQNIIALIGRDILQYGSFHYNGDGHISISLKNTIS